jgi:hypothetical protein
MRKIRPLHALPLLFALAGCPPEGTGTGQGTAPVDSALPTSGKIPKPPKQPPAPTDKQPDKPVDKAFDLGGFTKEALGELYKADVLLDETAKRAVHKKHGLIDDAGKPTPRTEAYEAALQRYAQANPDDEWSKLVEEIEKVRATRGASTDVPPK